MLSSFLSEVPPFVIFLIFAACGVGYALLVGWLGYDWFLTLAQEPPKPNDADDANNSNETDDESADKAPAKPAIPPPWDLFSRVLTLVSLAFVFILALTLNTFWSNNQDAESAALDEQNQAFRIVSMAQSLSDPALTDSITQAVKAYANTVVEEQWPLLEVAETQSASKLQGKAFQDLAQVVIDAGAAGGSEDLIWGEIRSAVTTLGDNAQDRLSKLPDSNAPTVIVLVVILGLALIGLTAAWLPTRPGIYRSALSIMAVIVALMVFIMVQASNPFTNHVEPTGLRTLISAATNSDK